MQASRRDFLAATVLATAYPGTQNLIDASLEVSGVDPLRRFPSDSDGVPEHCGIHAMSS